MTEGRDLALKIHRYSVTIGWDIAPAFEMWIQQLAVERKIQMPDGSIRRPWVSIQEKRNYPKYQDTLYVLDCLEDDWEVINDWIDGKLTEGDLE